MTVEVPDALFDVAARPVPVSRSPLVRSRIGAVSRRRITQAMAHDRVLYWGSGSVYCWRAMIVLEEKELPYEGKLLEFSKKEHKGPEVMALNPRGQLPTFKDGDAVLNESGAIVMYLENQYPEKPLLPSDPVKKAKVLQRCFEAIMTDVKQRNYTYSMRKGFDNPFAEQQIEEIKAEMALWNQYLSTQRYAATDAFTLADAMLAPMLLILARFGMTYKDYPNVKKYCDMIQERPSVAKTSPPHWVGAEPAFSFMNFL